MRRKRYDDGPLGMFEILLRMDMRSRFRLVWGLYLVAVLACSGAKAPRSYCLKCHKTEPQVPVYNWPDYADSLHAGGQKMPVDSDRNR